MAAPLEISEKQTSNDDFSNKTDPLSPAILDQDLSENVDHAGDTKDNESDDADDDKAKDDRNRNRNRNRKRIVILVILVTSVIAVLALIGVGIFLYYKFRKLTPIEIAQKKCKEYTNLACSLQSSSNKGPSQIFGGNIVRDRKMFPHQVYLLSKRIVGNSIRGKECGGSLINENFVLTAAHCVHNVVPDTMKVLVGRLNKHDPNETLWKTVKKFYIHPDSNNTVANPVADIALIELVGDVAFNSDIRPICLNTKLEKRYTSSIYATGWGRTSERGDTSDDLKMVEVRIDDESDKWCRLAFEELSPEKRELMQKTIICVAHVTTSGVQKGDSGGPLQVKLPSNCEYTWEQIGINAVVYGDMNYTGKKPSFLALVKVEHFIPWIVSVAWP